jgi:hypothetical protein
VDDMVRGAEAYAAVGVSTVVASGLGDDPVARLEGLFSPAAERLRGVRPQML